MLKIKDVGIMNAWNLDLNLLRISQIKKVECVFLVLIIIHNRYTSFSWKYSEGHSWFAWIDSIQRGIWCPHCVDKSKKLDIEYAKELACSRNRECLSNVYINYTMHLYWDVSNHMNGSLLSVETIGVCIVIKTINGPLSCIKI
jgi:hypothetical protein